MEAFLERFRERDALRRVDYGHQITGPMMAEVAWEIGYEGDPYATTLAEFEPLSKGLRVNLRAEYDRGAAAAR